MEEMNKYLGILIIILIIGFIFVFKILKKLIKAAIVVAVVIFGLSLATNNQISFEKVTSYVPQLTQGINKFKFDDQDRKIDIVKEIDNFKQLINTVNTEE